MYLFRTIKTALKWMKSPPTCSRAQQLTQVLGTAMMGDRPPWEQCCLAPCYFGTTAQKTPQEPAQASSWSQTYSRLAAHRGRGEISFSPLASQLLRSTFKIF